MRRVIALFGACDDDDAAHSARAYVDALDWLAACARFTETCVDDDDDDDVDDDDDYKSNGMRANASRGDVRYCVGSWNDDIARSIERDDVTEASDGRGTRMKRWLSRGAFLNVVAAARDAASRTREGDGGDAAHVTSAMSAASRVIGAMEEIASSSSERALDVVWFTPTSVGTSSSFDDVSAWSNVSMAMYGVFRRALELGPHVRVRVVTCGTGSAPRSALRVASTVGASTTSLVDDEVVDFGVRWRGSLAFASANGKERVEICGLSASRLPRCRRREIVGEDNNDDEPKNATKSALVARALRVVEVVRMRDIPSVYLSATKQSLRMNDADDGVGVSTPTTARDEFFHAWRSACASASTWGDAPAFVVQSQIALNTTLPHDAHRRRPVVYRDIVGERATPMLLYPVKVTTTTDADAFAVEFHLRAFTSLPELLLKLSTSVGGLSSRGSKRHFSTLDNLGTIARQDALNEAEQGLLILSERPLVIKGGVDALRGADDEEHNKNDDHGGGGGGDDDTDLPGIPQCDEAFSPDLTVKKSKVADLVVLATAEASAERGFLNARQSSEYVRRWECARETNTFASFKKHTTSSSNAGPGDALGFDEIVDALMERLTSSSSVASASAFSKKNKDESNGNVEGFLTETFTSCVDVALASINHKTHTIRAVAPMASDTSFTKDAAKTTGAERREARRREIEEKRENMLRSLGVDPSKTLNGHHQSSCEAQRAVDAEFAGDAPATTSVVVVTACPSCACDLVPIAGMNNCYRCGSSLYS